MLNKYMNESYIFITPVWGRSHTNAFVEIGLPSLLSGNNIPGMRNKDKIQYYIYSYVKDIEIIRNSKAFNTLQKFVTVNIIQLTEKIRNNHSMMSKCHLLGMQEAYNMGANAVFIPPDCVWADGSMRNMQNIVGYGYRLIHMSGIRIVLDKFSKDIKKYVEKAKGVLTIKPRELVALSLPYLHNITKDHFFREKSKALMPANLFWSVGNDGILARNFHLHPLLIKPSAVAQKFKSTIDDDLALIADIPESDEYVVTDSDEILAFEMSSPSHHVSAFYTKGDVHGIAHWAEVGTNDKHRHLIKSPIRIHASNIKPKLWRPIEQEAEAVVNNILQLLSMPKSLKVKTKITLKFAAKKILNFFDTVHFILFGKANTLSPLHWQWILEKHVFKPFVKIFAALKGETLYIDCNAYPLESYLPYESSNVTDIKTLSALKHFRLDLKKGKITNKYNNIVTRYNFAKNERQLFWDVVDASLKTAGMLLVYASTRNWINVIKDSIPKNYKVVESAKIGSLGSEVGWWIYKLQNKVGSNVFNRNITTRNRVLNSIMKKMIKAFGYLLYPPTSLCLCILHYLDVSGKFFTETRIQLQKIE